MKTNHVLTFLAIILILDMMTACQSKIPYGSTYYLPQQKREISEKKINVVHTEKAYVSIEKLSPISPSVEVMISNAERKISEINAEKNLLGNSGVKSGQQTVTEKNQLSAKALKQQRKESRKELKQILKEYKNDIKELKRDKSEKAASRNLTIGIVLAAIGLLLLLLVPGSVGYVLGTIALVIGIVLIVLDLI